MPMVYFFRFESKYIFEKIEYYFIYKKTKFKLIAGDEKYQNLLVTLVEDINFPKEAANNALEFIACLAWEKGRTEYSGSSGNGGKYNLQEVKRYDLTERNLLISEIKSEFPSRIINLNTPKRKAVAAIWQETLITKRTLPHSIFQSQNDT